MSERKDDLNRSFRDYLRRYFPKELERREREECCIHCGQKKSNPWKDRRA